MMRLPVHLLAVLPAVLLVATAPAVADDRDAAGLAEDGRGVWGFDPEASSAALARDGWQFMAMTGLSWPDGRQAVVTMWRSQIGDFARCVDYFDADMHQSGGKCERSGTGL